MLLLELLITVKLDTGTIDHKANMADASQCHNETIQCRHHWCLCANFSISNQKQQQAGVVTPSCMSWNLMQEAQIFSLRGHGVRTAQQAAGLEHLTRWV